MMVRDYHISVRGFCLSNLALRNLITFGTEHKLRYSLSYFRPDTDYLFHLKRNPNYYM